VKQNEVAMDPESGQSEEWRRLLNGERESIKRMRRVLGAIPSEPRCKLCAAPFGRPGHVLLRPLGFGPSRLNRRLCRACFRSLDKKPGGAEVEISLLFADVRGSTRLAEHMPPQEFSRLMARFYGKAAEVVDRWDGIVDKFVGDEVVALFVPAFAGSDHAAKAVAAARELLRSTGADEGDAWIPVGAGVHTGTAYVGRVGEGDACDFTALGDPVNITARLASSASAGEILVSSAAADAAGFDTVDLESRTLEIRGRDELVEAWVAGAVSAPEQAPTT
jgi:adenylate cyclase